MRKPTYVLFILFVYSWSFTPALGDDSTTYGMSLPDVLSHAEKQAYALQAGKATVDMARANARTAWQGILPSVTLRSTFLRSDDPVTVFGTKLRQGIFTANDFELNALNRPAEIDGFSTSLIAQIPLFNPQHYFRKLAAGQQVQSAELRLNWTRSVTSFQIRKAYWQLYLAGKREHALQTALRSAAAIRDNARLARENGMLGNADFLATELRHAELQEMVIVATNDLHFASDALKLLAGIDKPGIIIPLDSLQVDAALTENPVHRESSVDRPDLSAARQQIRAAKYALRQEQSGWLPRLNATISRDWHADKWLESDSDSWTVAATVELPLFSGLSRLGHTARASAQVKQSETVYKEMEQQSRQAVEGLIRTISAAQKRIGVAGLAAQQAAQGLDERRQRYAEGLETPADLLMQEALYVEAMLRNLQAQYDLQVAIDEYELLTGSTDSEQEKTE